MRGGTQCVTCGPCGRWNRLGFAGNCSVDSGLSLLGTGFVSCCAFRVLFTVVEFFCH